MKVLFKSEKKVCKHFSDNMPPHIIEKKIIIDFFANLPIESLKELVNFKEIDFENRELWNDFNNIEILSQLRDENVVKYTCELYLENND